eukprot:TRINITY_DN5544_c0_g1_i3.p1 TRINITY_DN5544_c0_g1~~TRINITY_DN5544_c0_g1_i3.p1  ORF type:complete len:540 (-),score=100.29 TRINITY_DN5544_c0_g1_i3:298-1917(-)
MKDEGENENIYKVCRKIKRKEQSLYNALRSIYEDSLFVSEIRELWPQLPMIANLRCGLWYSSQFDGTCYFKSTDGHTGNWDLNPSRLNLHVCDIAAKKGGCIIVDATRKGKRFPDSMSKTIPIWACVLNRAVIRCCNAIKLDVDETKSPAYEKFESQDILCEQWDCSLHLPLWVSDTEKASIEDRIDGWTKLLEDIGIDLTFLARNLRKPLRPLWISQKTVIWLNEIPDLSSWSFTPIFLVSASNNSERPGRMNGDNFSWTYIPGAADDEESWARGLQPRIFWKYFNDIISSGPDACNKMVADIVEKDRVQRSQRGQDASQIQLKTKKALKHKDDVEEIFKPGFDFQTNDEIFDVKETDGSDLSSEKQVDLCWIGDSGLAVGNSQQGLLALASGQSDSIIDCDPASDFSNISKESYLHIPVASYKSDRYALQKHLSQKHLSSAITFAKTKLNEGGRVFVSCSTGEDASVCVCLAIVISLFDNEGVFDNGKTFKNASMSKFDVRRQLAYICGCAPQARPSRGNLRQVYNFLRGNKMNSDV